MSFSFLERGKDAVPWKQCQKPNVYLKVFLVVTSQNGFKKRRLLFCNSNLYGLYKFYKSTCKMTK